MSSGTDRFASIESRIEIVMKMIIYNTIWEFLKYIGRKNLPKMEVFDAHLISNLIGVAFSFESLDIAKK